ncbi:FKBP-type peptidyl-prolyl cis-trans isomerase FkpA [Paucibacter oligotrophus]|uniref:Peptidyl-prolyl cis-trans isomerase n=1 Tax=Roseateles oligotrophus TaxID=1769250 RepID=A0A840L634_9BURK|nr:FKBP-type peptidyl-prolyl cis-trans isomerase FkpA [Roseateles oligotrophus]
MMIQSSFRASAIALALIGTLGLSACGGGGGSSTPADTSGSAAVSTLKITDSTVGTGPVAANGQNVSVHYTGWLYDVKATDQRGSKFDSSVDRGTPFSFKLGAGEVIAGWDQGVAGMKVGGKRTLLIPASLAYGSSGRGSIPPNAALVFDIQLLEVK